MLCSSWTSEILDNCFFACLCCKWKKHVGLAGVELQSVLIIVNGEDI